MLHAKLAVAVAAACCCLLLSTAPTDVKTAMHAWVWGEGKEHGVAAWGAAHLGILDAASPEFDVLPFERIGRAEELETTVVACIYELQVGRYGASIA